MYITFLKVSQAQTTKKLLAKKKVRLQGDIKDNFCLIWMREEENLGCT